MQGQTVVGRGPGPTHRTGRGEPGGVHPVRSVNCGPERDTGEPLLNENLTSTEEGAPQGAPSCRPSGRTPAG